MKNLLGVAIRASLRLMCRRCRKECLVEQFAWDAEKGVRDGNCARCRGALDREEKERAHAEALIEYQELARAAEEEAVGAQVRVARWRAREWAKAHPERVKASAKSRLVVQQELRLKVIAHLGGFCTCCRETEAAFLQVDHRERDGAAHRKAFNGNYRRIYRDILADVEPGKRFRLLCANCHFAESYRKGCPHRKAVESA